MGVGHLLLDGARRPGSRTRCRQDVDGTALPGDRQAKNFFESAGFKARHADHVPAARLSDRARRRRRPSARRCARGQEARRPWTERAGTGRRGPGGGGIGMPMSRASSGT